MTDVTTKSQLLISAPLLLVLLLLVVVIISLTLFLAIRPQIQGRYFHYPINDGTDIGSERRGIPARRIMNDKIAIYLDELFLGPTRLELSATAPEGTRVRHSAIIGKTLYVDLSQDILKGDSMLSISIDEALENIRYNLLFNFPNFTDIVFTIEGQQVYAPYYKL